MLTWHFTIDLHSLRTMYILFDQTQQSVNRTKKCAARSREVRAFILIALIKSIHRTNKRYFFFSTTLCIDRRHHQCCLPSHISHSSASPPVHLLQPCLLSCQSPLPLSASPLKNHSGKCEQNSVVTSTLLATSCLRNYMANLINTYKGMFPSSDSITAQAKLH